MVSEDTGHTDDVDEPAPAPAAEQPFLVTTTSPTFSLRDNVVVNLIRAAHPKQALLTALGLGFCAMLTGRAPEEVAVVVGAVLVGQSMLGWHNDIVDQRRDKRHGIAGKPIAEGKLDAGNAWYAIIAAFWLLLPLSVLSGITAGCIYLGTLAIGMLGNVLGRTGLFSWWSWAVSYGMYPAFLSYGGWGGQAAGDPPEVSITILAALFGIGVHFTRSVWGLVADHADGWTYLPLKLGLKLGATRLLMLSSLYLAVITVLLVVFGSKDGLSR